MASVVGHMGILPLLFYEYSKFAHTAFHLLGSREVCILEWSLSSVASGTNGIAKIMTFPIFYLFIYLQKDYVFLFVCFVSVFLCFVLLWFFLCLLRSVFIYLFIYLFLVSLQTFPSLVKFIPQKWNFCHHLFISMLFQSCMASKKYKRSLSFSNESGRGQEMASLKKIK